MSEEGMSHDELVALEAYVVANKEDYPLVNAVIEARKLEDIIPSASSIVYAAQIQGWTWLHNDPLIKSGILTFVRGGKAATVTFAPDFGYKMYRGDQKVEGYKLHRTEESFE